MLKYSLNRVLQLIPVVVIVSVVVFLLMNVLPGDVTSTTLGADATQDQRTLARHQLGLDKPLVVRYWDFLQTVGQGHLGTSLATREHVISMIAHALPPSIELVILSLLAGLIFGLPLGVLAAVRHHKLSDVAVRTTTMGFVAVPHFWLGVLLVNLFAVRLRLTPPSGYVPFTQNPVGNLQLMLLPMVTLGSGLAAIIARQTRASMLDVLSADYMTAATARGIKRPKRIYKHALRNAILPVITVTGLHIGSLIGGTVVTERIFNIPGVGTLLINSIESRDFPVTEGAVLLVVLVVLVVNLLVDLTYTTVDPRIKL